MLPIAGTDGAYHDTWALFAAVIFEAALVRVFTLIRINATSGTDRNRMVLFGWFRHSDSNFGLLIIR